jgi:hypothetical protein
MSLAGNEVIVTPVSASKPLQSYVQWGPILGGAVLATAISTIMTIFGSAVGLSLVSVDFDRSTSATALLVAGTIWALWITVSSCAGGGYLAGRMHQPAADANSEERGIRDGVHGLLAWATAAMLITLIATSSLFGVARTAASGAATAAAGAAALVTQQADPMGTALDAIMRTSGASAPTQAERDEASRIFVNALAAGKLEPADRDYLASRVAARGGLAQPDAERRIDEAFARVTQAKETAKQAVERARKMAVLTAFMTVAALLVGAAAAWMAAVLGGQHRDENIASAEAL